MEFFNSLIDEISLMCEKLPSKNHPYNCGDSWEDIGYSQVVLQRDTAFELKGTGFNLVTNRLVEDEVVIIGDDLSKLRNDTRFARISVLQLENQEDEQKSYNLIRKAEYVKYHYFPDGYMIRTSSRSHKEAVRVSKKAIKKGIDFKKVGNLLINKYKEIPAVKGVKIIFITDNGVDFSLIESIAEKNNIITETLNHIMNNVTFDCDSCNLKFICDEVEGMKALHFKNASEKGI